MQTKGCGDGDIRDKCEDSTNALTTSSLAGAEGRLIVWTGSTEAEINRQLVAPSCLLHTKIDGSYYGDSGTRDTEDLIRISSDGESDIHDDLDVDVVDALKGQVYFQNGDERSPVTINDLAIQQAICPMPSQGCEGYVATFSHGVEERGDSETASQITCVKTKEVGSEILTNMLVKDMPMLRVSPAENLSNESAAEEQRMRAIDPSVFRRSPNRRQVPASEAIFQSRGLAGLVFKSKKMSALQPR